MSKLSEFLKSQDIDPRRVLVASKKLERLHPEDRRIRLAKHRVREGNAADRDKQLADKKPRSGKPVTEPTLRAALEGEKLSSGAQARIKRAVNRVLQQKNKKQVSAQDLF